MPKYYKRGRLPKSVNRSYQYKVVLYCNHKKVKVLYKSRVIFPAREKYNNYLQNNVVYFEKKWDAYNKPVQYELLLIGNYGDALEKYKAPSGVVYNVGKTKDGFIVKDIQPYHVEEKFKYFNEQKIIKFKDLITVLMKEKYSKSIIAFHNKISVEIFEKDEILLFILKNASDAERLYQLIKTFYYENKMTDCFFFNKPANRIELSQFYDKIQEKTGIARLQLTKRSTKA